MEMMIQTMKKVHQALVRTMQMSMKIWSEVR